MCQRGKFRDEFSEDILLKEIKKIQSGCKTIPDWN